MTSKILTTKLTPPPTMTNIAKLLQERAGLVSEMRKIVEAAEKENRRLNAEEKQKHSELRTKVGDLKDRVETLQEQKKLDEETRKREIEDEEKRKKGGSSNPKDETTDEQRAFRSFLRGGADRLQEDERRALSMGTDTEGGYVAPEQFLAELIKNVTDEVYVRQVARVIPLATGQSLGVPSLDTRMARAAYTSELSIGTADSSMKFGKRRMEPHPLTGYILISRDLIQSAAIPIEQEVIMDMTRAFAEAEEEKYMTGSGSGEPLGVFTASDSGIPTSRDASTGNTTTGITFDGLLSAKFDLKPQYRSLPSTRWMFHTDAMEQISKLKDGEDRYIWTPSTREGEPDRILGIPYFESRFVPNTFTTGQYVGILGDWQSYWIADATQMEVQRLVEKWADTNQIGFIGRRRNDAAPVRSEAFVRVKLA